MKVHVLAAFALVLATGACASTPESVPVVVGYSTTMGTPPPATMSVGSPVPIVFTVTENESDGSSRPAAGKSFTVTITGGGTVNGADSVMITTATDGSAAVVWVLGPTAGSQSLRGALTPTQHLDVSIAATALPTLRVINGTCIGGHCDSIAVLAFPHNQPGTPGGYWSVLLGTVTGPAACFTLPPSATFTISGPNATTVLTWTPAIPLSLGLTPADGRLFATPATTEFVSGSGASWQVTLPGGQVTPESTCAP